MRGDAPNGAASSKDNLNEWSDRASQYSDGADHRASNGPMVLPKTGKKVELRDTAAAPYRSRKVDNAMVEGKTDLNHYVSDYMRGIRRGG
jgi:hypothetical protein